MTDHAELDFNTVRATDQARGERRSKIMGRLLALIAAVTLVLVMAAESRMTSEQRVKLFETSSYAYP